MKAAAAEMPCSFCGKSRHEVRRLIAGPSVFICDECVGMCVKILREELPEHDLADLIAPENAHAETDTGPAVGGEVLPPYDGGGHQ